MVAKKKEEVLKKDFYSFQKKVNRLEELKHELQSLESGGVTKGFEREVKLIRSRLRDTTALPELEKLMRDLRKKILKRKIVKRKSPLKKIFKIAENVEELADTDIEIKKEIKHLESSLREEINKKAKTDSEVEFVVDKGFKDFMDGVNKGIKSDKRTKYHIKTGFVDKGFKDFIEAIKSELSKRIRNKEELLNQRIKQDLLLRRRELDEKYKTMRDSLNQEYKDKLKIELHKEVSQKFEEELKKKFEEEREKLDADYLDKIKHRFQQEFEKQKKIIENRAKENFKRELTAKQYDIDKEISRLRNESMQTEAEKKSGAEAIKRKISELERQKAADVAKMETFKSEIKRKLAEESHRDFVYQINSYKNELDERLRRQFADKMQKFVSDQKVSKDKEIDERTKKLREALDKQQKLISTFSGELSKSKLALESEKQRNSELDSILKNDIRMREKQLKFKYLEFQKKLKKEYDDKVSNELSKEISKRFNEELRQKINEEKERLDRDYVASIKKKYSDELERRKKALEGALNERMSSELKKNKSLQQKLESEIKETLMMKESDRKKNILQREYDKKHYEKEITKKRAELERTIETDKKHYEQKVIIKNAEFERLKERIKKELTEEAHRKLIRDIASHRKEQDAELRKQFEARINNFILEQRRKQDGLVENKVRELKKALEREQRDNEEMARRFAEKSDVIQRQKERNKELLSKQSQIRHDESFKRDEEHKQLVDQHKEEVRRLTETLKKEFHNKFERELNEHIRNERLKLQQEYALDKKDLISRMQNFSFREKLEFKKNLKDEYRNKLRKSVEEKKRKLYDAIRRDFGREANDKIIIERKKLENKIKQLNKEYGAREAALKIKEKNLMAAEITKNLEMASEKRKLLDQFNVFKREEDIKLKNERIRMKRILAEKAHHEMLGHIREREEMIKKKMEKELKERMEAHDKAQEEALSRKKTELVKELRMKTQSLLR